MLPVPGRQGNDCGFSLVELLVVIAIISVLAGLLLPVLEESLGAARILVCLNNQKQLASASLMRIDDDDGIIPFGNYLSPYRDALGRNGPDLFCFIMEGEYIPYTENSAGRYKSDVLACPDALSYTKISWPDPEWYGPTVRVLWRNNKWGNPYQNTCVYAGDAAGTVVNGVYTHYWPNTRPTTASDEFYSNGDCKWPFAISGQWVNGGPHKKRWRNRITQLDKPSDTFLSDEKTVFRHLGVSTCFSYFDGHGECLRPGELDAKLTGGKWKARHMDARYYVRR